MLLTSGALSDPVLFNTVVHGSWPSTMFTLLLVCRLSLHPICKNSRECERQAGNFIPNIFIYHLLSLSPSFSLSLSSLLLYSADRILRNSNSSEKWLLRSAASDRHPSTGTTPSSAKAFFPQGSVEKEELYTDPEVKPVITSVFVSLADTSEGGQHQYEYIDPKSKEEDNRSSPEYALTEASSSSPHNELVGNGYNTLTHDTGPPCNHYNKLDHTLPKKRDGTDSLYSSLNEGKGAFYNSLEEIDKKGSERYANIGNTPDTTENTLPLLFDDPNYSPVRSKKAEHPAPVDKKYTGDYERAPGYVAHKQELNSGRDTAATVNGGSAKRSDEYVPMSAPNSVVNPSTIGVREDRKYIGEYERAPDYVPHGQKNRSKDHNEYIPMSIASTHSDSVPAPGASRGTEYTGDYKRDPNYLEHLSSTPPTDYQSLAGSLMDSPSHYTHPAHIQT